MTVLRLGTFDAERWWRPAELAGLPAVATDSAATVDRMDELLAGCCAPEDLLLTRGPLAPALRDQLAAVGLEFGHRSLSGAADVPAERLALDHPGLAELAAGRPGLDPYAVLPDTAALAARLGRSLPDPAVVATVNSKVFSCELVRDFGLPHAGRVVRSVAELTEAVSECPGPALVKDPYGVSGRGTLEVATPGVLRAIARTLARQVARGRRVELVVQPKLDRRCDFSAQLFIGPDGTPGWRGVVLMDNRGFRHLGSSSAPPRLLRALHGHGYRDTVLRVGQALAERGYRGPAGVDSMLLAGGELVPVLEINARQSMGSLLLRLAERLAAGASAHLRQLDLDVPPGRDVADLLAALRADGALSPGNGAPGVVVLTGSGLAASRGRVHFLVICPAADLTGWLDRVAGVAAGAGMRGRGGARVA